MDLKNEQNKNIVSGVMFGYLVLLLHVLLIIGLGLVVVLVKGIYDFRWLIFICGIALIGWSGYYFYQRIKRSNRKLSDLIADPALLDRTVEISLLGGMATVKLGHRNDSIRLIDATTEEQTRQLAAPEGKHLEQLAELNRMLEAGLISREEFLDLKKEIF